jgi:hypothetical protein
MKVTAIDNGNSYICQRRLSTIVIDNSYQQQLLTMGQWRWREDSNKYGNGARMPMVLGQHCCKDGYQQRLLTMSIDDGY